jgi:hypothetical protein
MNMHRPGRLLLGLAALILLAGGAFHGLMYPKAVAMISASNLPARGAVIYKALWLNDAEVVMLIGLIYGVLAWRPAIATRLMLALLSALPLAGALTLYSTVGNFLPGHLLLTASILAALAVLLSQPDKRAAIAPAPFG